MRFFKRKEFLQYNQEDCGAACLATVLSFYGKETTISRLRNQLSYDKNGATIYAITEVSNKYGVFSEAFEGDFSELVNATNAGEIKFPLIAHLYKAGVGGHYIVIKAIKNSKVLIFDPGDGLKKLKNTDFQKSWTGNIISFDKKNSINCQSFNQAETRNFRYIKILLKEKKTLISVIFISLFLSVVSIISSMIYRNIIDNYLMKSSDYSNIQEFMKNFNFLLLIFSLFFFYLIQFIISLIYNLFIAKASERLSNDLSKSFLQHLINISEKNLYYFESGDILSRFESVFQVQTSLIQIIMTLSTSTLAMILGGSILIWISFELFVFTLFTLIGYFMIFAILLPKLKKYRREFYTYYSESITGLNELLVGKSTITMSNANKLFFNRIYIKINQSNKNLYKSNIIEGTMSSSISLAEMLGGLAILWKGSLLVIQTKITLGSLIVFQNMMSSFILPMQKLILVQNELQHLKILTQRLDDLYDIEIERVNFNVEEDFLEANYDIELKGVAFAYFYEQFIFENINLYIRSGSKLAIIGDSGSGKSTLIKIIASIYEPTLGDISISHIRYKELSLYNLRGHISYVDQNPFIINGSIFENITMSISISSNTHSLIKKIAELCELYNFTIGHSNDLEMQLVENGANLSGGQKQRIGIARALIKEPRILLLDEATSNIDQKGQEKILEYIFHKDQLTVISISHNKSVNSLATSHFYLNRIEEV